MDITLDDWRSWDEKKRSAAANAIAAEHPSLALLRMDAGDFGLPVFAHKESGIILHLVPGGRFTMGMRPDEIAHMREQYSFYEDADDADRYLASESMRPPIEMSIRAYLLAAHPLGSLQMEWLRADPAARATLSKGRGRKTFDYDAVAKLPAPSYLEFLEQSAAGELENDEVEEVETALRALGLRLPSDAEWERAARGGDGRTFASGNTLPTTPSTGIGPFGFTDLGATCDVCADGAEWSLEGIRTDGTPRPASEHRVVRGGAANTWPWQGPGWTILACAYRGSMEAEAGLLAIRPAMGL